MPNPNYTLTNSCTLKFLYPNTEPRLNIQTFKKSHLSVKISSTTDILDQILSSPDQIISFKGHIDDIVKCVLAVNKYYKSDAYTNKLVSNKYKLIIHCEYVEKLEKDYRMVLGRCAFKNRI